MFAKNLVLSLFAALSLVGCTPAETLEDESSERADVEGIEHVLSNGGAFVVRVPPIPRATIPACGESLCDDDTEGGCCASEHGTICYSCELPPPPEPIAPSECDQDADCGDPLGGDRCNVDKHGSGTCYRVCGGALGFTCAADEICLLPLLESLPTFQPNQMGVCFSAPTDDAAELDWSAIARHAAGLPSKVDHLREGIIENAAAE